MPTNTTDAYTASLVSPAQIRKAWRRHHNASDPPEIGDIVGWQIDPAHAVTYAFVRGWYKDGSTVWIKVTNVHPDNVTYGIDPEDVVSLYRQAPLE